MPKKLIKIVPDTSVLISGRLVDEVEKMKNVEVIIPEFVIEEMRAQASRGREIGFKGLEELKKLRQIKNVKIKKAGRRQTYEEIQLAKYGRIDALILDVAKQEKAILYTSDRVQALTAEVEGVEVRFFEPYEKKEKIKLIEMFTEDTMSVHLKEGAVPLAKRGRPGKFKLVKIRNEPMEAEELEEIIHEILEVARYEEDGYIELGEHTATVIQLGDMRVSIARPPFSDGIEITAVRPIAKVSLDDYRLADKLKKRFLDKTRGILIAGPPGSGKSTFAAAIAEFFERNGKIVKTLESPRDMQVGPAITQYTKLKGSFENTADLLLLVRPDNTIFDEVRKTEEFMVFSDMRLAGIGMVGVVHASEPVDAIQRFIGRVELGMIPHIIDTVIFIEGGEIKSVFELNLTVRTPAGMTEEDLARPIVEVRDFESGELKYEIYTYGEENVIMPVKEEKESAIKRLAKEHIIRRLRKFDRDVSVEIINDNKVLVKADNNAIPKLIGRQGETIKRLEEELGIAIEVVPKVDTLGKEVEFEYHETGGYLVFLFKNLKYKLASFYVDDRFVVSVMIGKNNSVRIRKKSKEGRELLKGLVKGKVRVFV